MIRAAEEVTMVDFPTSPDLISADWLADVLGQPAGALTGFTVTPVGTGQMCDSFRLALDWRGGQPAGAPATVIAKCPSHDETSRAIAAQLGAYRLETSWYLTLANEVPVPRPHCYYSTIADNDVDFLLLLGDLAPARQGDQLGGASKQQLLVAAAAGAALHAPLWNSPRLETIDWLQRDSRPTIKAAFPVLYEQFKERYATRLSADVLALGSELTARIDRYLDREASAFCLQHGDFRVDNILFSPDATAAHVVDWQTLARGNGAFDIAYLIGTSTADAATRAADEREIFDAWLTGLRSGGVTPDAAALWADYRVGAFSGFVMAVFASMNVERTERGDEMFAVMAERPAQQAIDLDSLALI